MTGTSYDLHLKISADSPGNWMRLYGLICPLSWGASVSHMPRDAEPLWPVDFALSYPAPLGSQATQGFGT